MDPRYVSSINRHVPPARPGEFAPLPLGSRLHIWPPVVLAPMAGVTNWPFRALCRRFGAGLYVSEMVTARPLVEGRSAALRLTDFGPDERPRSLQLYGVDPYHVGEAVARLVGEGRVDHIDLNFGCPVPKVTRRGGGAALPARPRLLAAIVQEAVRRAGEVPLTIKVRMGLDESWITWPEAARIAEEAGCAAITLHARTAAQHYDGHAHWDTIGELKQRVRIPVIGNGDVWEGKDALRMMRQSGCDAVAVGRGCLGRPWLFGDLHALFEGREPPDPPRYGEVVRIAMEHARMLAEWLGERHAMREFRKHAAWYTKGFRGSAAVRRDLARIETLADLEAVLGRGDPSEPFPPEAMRAARGKRAGRQRRLALPEDLAAQRDSLAPLDPRAEALVSGG